MLYHSLALLQSDPEALEVWKKAQQFDLFAPREEVQRPGIRGGKYYLTETGHVKYGEKRVEAIDRELASLQGKYERKMAGAGEDRPALVPPPIRAEALQGIAARMDKLDAEKAALTPALVANMPVESPDPKVAAKVRHAGDALTPQIERYMTSGANPNAHTRRQSSIAASMFQQGEFLQGIQQVLYALADMHENGRVPPLLAGVRTKVAVETLLLRRPWTDQYTKRRSSRFPHPLIDTTQLAQMREAVKDWHLPPDQSNALRRVEARAEAEKRGEMRDYIHLLPEEMEPMEAIAQQMIDRGGENKWVWSWASTFVENLKEPKRAIAIGLETEAKWDEAAEMVHGLRHATESSASRKIREAERALIGRKIPGYFPTPTAVVEHMLDLADIQPGQTILEPSAGKGNIADLIRTKYPENLLLAIEWDRDLREVLKLKGIETQLRGEELTDFMQFHGKTDTIVMNPPFEHGQDMDHVKHAYDLLTPGGRLVSIMGEHAFFAQDAHAVEFREWLDEKRATVEDMAEGSFKSSERPTGVKTRIVVISKPELSGMSYGDRVVTDDGDVGFLRGGSGGMGSERVTVVDAEGHKVGKGHFNRSEVHAAP